MTWQQKQRRKADAMAKIEAEKNAINVSALAAEYYTRQIEPITNTLTFSAAAYKKHRGANRQDERRGRSPASY
jgi:hypothetical protein